MASPPPGLLPTSRTEEATSLEVIGVDYAEPLLYRAKNKKERKAYVLLYTCSLTRAVYLDLLPTLEMDEFISSCEKGPTYQGILGQWTYICWSRKLVTQSHER